MKNAYFLIKTFIFALASKNLVANEGSAPLDFYASICTQWNLPPEFAVLLGSLLVLFATFLVGMRFRRDVEEAIKENKVAPTGKVGVFFFVESILGFLEQMAKEQCGKEYRRFLPLLSGLFFFILLANLSGLLPGFPPPTENFSANLGLGIIVFIVYNAAGIREHGIAYIKQFTGPFLLLAPLFLVLEFISHAVRPISLSFRLLANIFADHLVLSVFSSIAPFFVPALLLFFGLLVAFVQSFVFTMLTSIYINMAISHDH